MTIDERQGGVVTARQEFAEYLSLIKHEKLSPEIDTSTVLYQFSTCLKEGGSYVIADSISVLESYTRSLGLDNDRTQEIVELINLFEQLTPESCYERFTLQCNLIGAMLRMVLDSENPNMIVARGLFEILGDIATSVRQGTIERKTITSYDAAGQIIRRYLEDACTDVESLLNVRKFADELIKESAGSHEVYGRGFLRDFIGRKRAIF